MLTATKVNEVFMDCLFKDGEDTTGFVEAHGIVINVGFNPTRLESQKETVKLLLNELPDSFKEGMTFLQACFDRHGNQWTGEHRTMEQLFLLGLATELVRECAPREMWHALPGGMPYYMVEC